MSRRHFRIREFAEFLMGGNVATLHTGPIPIWAGFIIEQNARILEILENTVTSNESQLQADLAQLIAINTDVKATLADQVGQITDLQGQVAGLKAKLGDGSITADDLAALDSAVNDLAATAASAHATSSTGATNAAPSTPVDPQTPIVGAPADSGSTDTSDAPAADTGAPVADPSVPDASTAPADADGDDKVSGADTTATDTDGSTATDSTGYGL